MALFIAVVALYLAQIVCRSAQMIPVSIIVFFLICITRLGCVDSTDRGGTFLTSSVLLLPSATAFFLFLSLSGRLQVTGAGSCQFRSPDLRLFFPEILYWLALVLSRGGIGWLGAPKTVLVYILNSGPQP